MTTITTIDAGSFLLDGGAMFGVAPRVLWQRHHRPDAQNRIRLVMRLLLIETADRLILVDAGLGDGHSARFLARLGSGPDGPDTAAALTAAGRQPAAITDVILTHLHFDHAGGLLRRGAEGLQPTFPQARFWVQRRQWDWARQPALCDRASYQSAYLDYLARCGRLELRDGPGPFCPDVELICLDGHTPGQQTVVVTADTQTWLYGADLFPLAAHINPAWNMAFDLEPLRTAAEKQCLLEQAVAGDWTIIFAHDPATVQARVQCRQGRFVGADEG